MLKFLNIVYRAIIAAVLWYWFVPLPPINPVQAFGLIVTVLAFTHQKDPKATDLNKFIFNTFLLAFGAVAALIGSFI